MKIKLLIAVFIVLSFNLVSQEDSLSSTPPPVDSIKVQKKKNKMVETRFLGLDYGLAAYAIEGKLNLPSELDAFELNHWKSNQWRLHVIGQRIKLLKNNNIALCYGLGFDFNRYSFTNAVNLINTEQGIEMQPELQFQYSKNRLFTSYLSIPLLFDFRIPIDEAKTKLKLSVGTYGSMLLASNLVQQVEGSKDKDKVKNDFHLQKYVYGLEVRLGIKKLVFYARYGLNGMFKENKAPQFAPYNFGIQLLGF